MMRTFRINSLTKSPIYHTAVPATGVMLGIPCSLILRRKEEGLEGGSADKKG